jgi:hypothetical protein
MKRAAIASPIILLLLMVGCTDSDLQKVAKDLNIIAVSVGTLQTDVIAANNAKLISDDTTAKILNVCVKISVAGKQADSVVRAISKLDPTSKTTLVNLLTPISQALDPAALEFIAGVKDPGVKQKIDGAFIILRSTVSALQLIIAGS